MKVLLTGASGYLGQFLVQSLTENQEVELTCLCGGSNTDFLEAMRTNFPSITTQALDITDETKVSEWMDGKTFDVCIHTAALSSPRVCQAEAKKAQQINCPTKFLSLLQDSHIIALSTDQVYDGENAPYRENSDEPPRPWNVYGQTKLDMESYLLANNPNSVLLRSSIILGPKAPISKAHDTFLHFCASRQDQPTEFYSDQIRSVISVHDVVATIECFMKNSHCGVYNMGGPDAVSRVDMATAVFQHLGFDTSAILSKPQPSGGPVPTPRNIHMDSSKLNDLITTRGLPEIVRATLGERSSA